MAFTITSHAVSNTRHNSSSAMPSATVFAHRPWTERARSKRPWIVNVEESARERASVDADAGAGAVGEEGDDGDEDEEKGEAEGDGVGSGKRDEMSLSVRLV